MTRVAGREPTELGSCPQPDRQLLDELESLVTLERGRHWEVPKPATR